MPTVPSPQAQVNRSPLPGPRLTAQVNADTLGAGVAEGAQAVVNVGAKIYQEEKQKADQIVVLNAYNQTAQLNQGLTNDALNKKGMDAFGVLDSSMTEYDKQTGDIAGSLHNDEQRLEYQRIRQQGRLQLNETLQRHVAREHQVVDNENKDAALNNSWTAARTAAANQPPDIADAMIVFEHGEQRRIIEQYAQRNGMSRDWVNAEVDKSISATNAGVIDQLTAQGDDITAKEFFEAHKDTFKGVALTHAQATVAESSTRGAAQRIGDDVLKRIVSGDIQTEEEARAEAIRLAGDSVKLRDAAINEAESNFHLHERSVKDQEQKVFSDADAEFQASGSSWKGISPATWTALNSKQQQEFKHRQHQFETGELVPDGSPKFYELYKTATTPALMGEFAKMDIDPEQSKMSPKDFRELKKMQGDIRTNSPEIGDEVYKNQAIKDLLVNNGFNAEPYTTKNGQQTANADTLMFYERFRNEVRYLQSTKGEKLSPTEIENTAKTMLAKVTASVPIPESRDWTRRELTSYIFGNTKWKVGQAGYEDVEFSPFKIPDKKIGGVVFKPAFNVTEIPASEIGEIKASIEARGESVTEDKMLVKYNQWLAAQDGQ
jgi:hypothetical protein